jgi:CheY-like chemotaxis protein
MPARIVVVLNSPELADATVSALTDDGYDALAVHDSMAALDLLEQAKDIELLVTSTDFSEGKPNGWQSRE